jgi:hypothetical protein
MFATTLRITDELGSILQDLARFEGLSVNAFLARLIEQEREARRRRRLGEDWAAYAREGLDAAFALEAQAERVSEVPIPYRVEPKGRPKRRGRP